MRDPKARSSKDVNRRIGLSKELLEGSIFFLINTFSLDLILLQTLYLQHIFTPIAEGLKLRFDWF